MAQPTIRPIAGPQAMPFAASHHLSALWSRAYAKSLANFNASSLMRHIGKQVVPNTTYPLTLGPNSLQYFHIFVDGTEPWLGIVLHVYGWAPAKLFVKRGNPPTLYDWDGFCISTINAMTTPGVGFVNPAVDNWYILVQGLAVGPAALIAYYGDQPS